MSGRDRLIQHAFGTPFDPDNDPNCSLTEETVQEVIEELCTQAQQSASPGFSWGRKGNHNDGTWLKNNDVSSNKTGLPFGLNNGSLKKVTVCNKRLGAEFDIKIWHHLGDLVSATLLVTVTTDGLSTVQDFIIDVPVPKDVMLAIEIDNVKQNGSDKPKETQVFLVVKGEI